ncbi:MAG: hypothetical protein CL916_08415, partial [Deltaproteobacteria bacterium]|nr:hypothetical protein [Deltaproteobacteria bacterium]
QWGAIKFHAVYLLISLFALGVWMYLPVFSLACFLLYSIVHFGRDWRNELPYQGLAYGCIILGAPALFHHVRVDELFQVITFNHSPPWLVTALQSSVALGMALMLPNKSNLSSKLWIELIVLFCAAIIFEPMWYFLIYFCFLHSPKHLLEEWRQLSSHEKNSALKMVTVITSATCVLVATLAYYLGSVNSTLNDLAYQSIFIGLATLTIPHMLLIAWVQSDQFAKDYTIKDKVNIHVV